MDQLYSKKGGERVFDFLAAPKVVWHNRVPPKHSYYWVTEPLMRYHLGKIVWMLIFNKGLIRHLIIWKTLHFKALTQIWLSKVNGPALLKERWRKGFDILAAPKVVWHNRVPPKHSQLLNNMNVWMVLYCAQQLLGLKKIKNPFSTFLWVKLVHLL